MVMLHWKQVKLCEPVYVIIFVYICHLRRLCIGKKGGWDYVYELFMFMNFLCLWTFMFMNFLSMKQNYNSCKYVSGQQMFPWARKLIHLPIVLVGSQETNSSFNYQLCKTALTQIFINNSVSWLFTIVYSE